MPIVLELEGKSLRLEVNTTWQTLPYAGSVERVKVRTDLFFVKIQK
jgi:hypothetical protein